MTKKKQQQITPEQLKSIMRRSFDMRLDTIMQEMYGRPTLKKLLLENASFTTLDYQIR